MTYNEIAELCGTDYTTALRWSKKCQLSAKCNSLTNLDNKSDLDTEQVIAIVKAGGRET